MSDSTDSLSKEASDLAGLLKQGAKPKFNPELLKLAKQAIAARDARKNEDPEEWAKKLVDSMYNSPGFKDSDY
jgi:hypothetical protein